MGVTARRASAPSLGLHRRDPTLTPLGLNQQPVQTPKFAWTLMLATWDVHSMTSVQAAKKRPRRATAPRRKYVTSAVRCASARTRWATPHAKMDLVTAVPQCRSRTAYARLTTHTAAMRIVGMLR